MASTGQAEWKEAQAGELAWWMTFRNRHQFEIEKSNYVARSLNIQNGRPGASVIDIGSGPLSLLLRVPTKAATALDPLDFGDLEEAYKQRNIRRLIKPGEELSPDDGSFDEAWIYNCLQHVQDPDAVIQKAICVAKVVRLFEWVFIPPYDLHPHELRPDQLQRPFQNAGWTTLLSGVTWLNFSDLNGHCFTGIFRHPDVSTSS